MKWINQYSLSLKKTIWKRYSSKKSWLRKFKYMRTLAEKLSAQLRKELSFSFPFLRVNKPWEMINQVCSTTEWICHSLLGQAKNFSVPHHIQKFILLN